MKHKILSAAMSGAALVFALAGNAQAVAVETATYCAGGANGQGLAVSDVTFSGNTPTTAADGCYGLTSADSASAINALGLWGGGWTQLLTDNLGGGASAGSFGGIDYTLSFLSGTLGSGTWQLSATGALPVHVDLIVALSKGNQNALYWFDDVLVSGADSGDWVFLFSTGSSSQNQHNPNHMGLFIRNAESQNGPGGPAQIPEPAGIALFGLAMAGAAGAMRRRQR